MKFQNLVFIRYGMHKISFQFYLKGHNSRKGDNLDMEKNFPLTNFPREIHIWNVKILICIVLDKLRHNPKPICTINFFEAGGIMKHHSSAWYIITLCQIRIWISGLTRASAQRVTNTPGRHHFLIIKYFKVNDNNIVCLCWGFKAQSTQWGHVERGQFT